MVLEILVVLSFLMGSIVAGSFLGLGYLRDIRRSLKQLNQVLEDQNLKLDCIAEWLIDQDPDCDPDCDCGIEFADYPHSIGNEEDQFGSAEEWKQFYEEDVNNE